MKTDAMMVFAAMTLTLVFGGAANLGTAEAAQPASMMECGSRLVEMAGSS